MAKKKQKPFSVKKCIKTIKSWYKKDENGHMNHTARILFEFLLALPIVVFEGIKVGFYAKLTSTTGFFVIAEGLFVPATQVYALRHNTPETGFGNQYAGFEPAYLGLFMLLYATAFAAMYMTAERNKNKSYDKDGDMKFGNIEAFNKRMAVCNEDGEPEEPPEDKGLVGNMILSQNIRYSLEPKGVNTYSCALIIGATGSGKSFRYVKPNVLQMNSNYVITDPKGELTQDLGGALMKHGYEVKVFNINEPEYSCKYNPFRYIRNENDVVTAVSVFLENTKETDAGSGDPFFPLAEKNFYLMLFFYVYTVYKDQPEKQNLKTIYEMYQLADEPDTPAPRKGEAPPESEFDKMFKELARKDPTNPSLPYYVTFKKGSPKTKQSILISVGVKLWFLSVGAVANLMSDDTLELERMADRKTALFFIIPAEKDTYKCLSAMLFTQLFETLYYVGNTLNEKSFFVQYGNCVALRSKPFIAGTSSETTELENLKNQWEKWKSAIIEDDNELIETDPAVREKFSTSNKDGIIPFPKVRLICTNSVTGEKEVLEEFQSRKAAELVLEAIEKGEIKRGAKTLTNHIRFVMDEFFNLGKIDGFDRKIATFRSLRISADIIIQSIGQLKELYEDHESKITNNCSITLSLGVNSMDDCQYLSDMMGQTTVRSESVSVNHKGLIQGSDGTNLSDNAQMLMRPEKIRSLPDDQTLVLVNTQLPLIDVKYDALKHPRWKESYSDKDPSMEPNLFQYRRLFYIEQESKNRIVTIIKDNNPPASISKGIDTAGPRPQISGTTVSDLRKQREMSARSIDDEKAESMAKRRNEIYERLMRKRRFEEEQLQKMPLAQQIAHEFQSKENEHGEIPIATLNSMGLDAADILVNAVNAKNDEGKPLWRLTEAKTPGGKLLEPTEDNKEAAELLGIKKEQIVASAADAFDSDDLWG